MRLLVVTAFQRLTEEAASGFAVRQRLFIEAIRKVGAQVHVLLLAHSDLGYGGGPGTQEGLFQLVQQTWGIDVEVSICQREASPSRGRPLAADGTTVGLFSLPGYASTSGDRQRDAVEAALDRGADLLFVHRLVAIPPVIRARRKLPPLCMDLDDIESLAYLRHLRQSFWRPSRWFDALDWPALRAGEDRALAMADQVYVCSALDVEKVQARRSQAEVIAVPNTVPAVNETGPRCRKFHVLMLGNYGHPPNRQGIERFVRRIWPRIRSACPDALLRVAGPGGTALSLAASKPLGVEVMGFVEDLRRLYADTALVVCPIYSGGGTRVKLVEAAAHGVPSVSTRLGAEGLGMRDGHDILLADGDAEFAQACIDLLRDPLKADRIGQAAHAVARTRFDRAAVVAQLSGHMARLMVPKVST